MLYLLLNNGYFIKSIFGQWCILYFTEKCIVWGKGKRLTYDGQRNDFRLD